MEENAYAVDRRKITLFGVITGCSALDLLLARCCEMTQCAVSLTEVRYQRLSLTWNAEAAVRTSHGRRCC